MDRGVWQATVHGAAKSRTWLSNKHKWMNNLVSHWGKIEIILSSPALTIKSQNRDFPGGPVVRTLYFHCREHKFSPWWVNGDPVWLSQKKRIKYSQLRFWIIFFLNLFVWRKKKIVTLNPYGRMCSILRLCVRQSLLQILLCSWVGSSPQTHLFVCFPWLFASKQVSNKIHYLIHLKF